MKITNTQVFGFEASLRAMRNPKNSWGKSDSAGEFILGRKDAELSRKLTKAGTEHCKHLRMITVWADMELPRYLWQEMDTYRHIEKVSCSTMHKLFERELSPEDFSLENHWEGETLEIVIEHLNHLGEQHRKNSDPQILARAKGILPESYLQKRTICTNYQQLLNIYNQRKCHRLQQWRKICDWILEMPHLKALTGVK